MVILYQLRSLRNNIICLPSFIFDNILFHFILMLNQNIVDRLIVGLDSFSDLTFLNSLWILFEFIQLWTLSSRFWNGWSFLFLVIYHWKLVFTYALRSSFVENFWHFVFVFTIFNVVIHFIKILRYFFISCIFRTQTSTFRIQIVNKPIFRLQNHIFPRNR